MGNAAAKGPVDSVELIEPSDSGLSDDDFSAALRTNLPRLFAYARSLDATTQMLVAERLANEAVLAKRQGEIVALGGLTLLVPLARSRDAEVQRLATHALANLSALAANQRAIAATPECLAVLLQLLASPLPEVSRQAAKTVANISVVPENMRLIGDSGGVGPLVLLVSSRAPKTRVEAIAAVANLAVDDANEKMFVEAGVFSRLVAAVPRPLPADADLCTQVARALRNLSARKEHAAALRDTEGAQELIALMCACKDERVRGQAEIAREHLRAAGVASEPKKEAP
jgi:hypothetical protein